MKAITRVTTALLSGLLILLGFGGCRSSKRAAQKAAEEAEQARLDSIQKAQQQPQSIIGKDDPTRIRVLYGPPPARYRKDIK